MTDCGVVFMTASSREEAEKIAQALISKKLAACVQIIPEIYSRYWWEGRVCNDREVLLIAKTTQKLFPALTAAVQEVHSYQVPEIVFTPICDGLPQYLAWIHDVTAAAEDPTSSP
jgi:periplasmic divalent cation tolerance protein